MPRPQIIKNPFYLLLALVGFAFVITVVAYWLMSLAVIRDPLAEKPRDGLFDFLEVHGTTLLIWEVGGLVVLSLAAMMTDDFWMRLWQRKDQSDTPPSNTLSPTTSSLPEGTPDESHVE